MQGGVVDVCANAITDVEAKASRFGALTKMLLLVADKVFGTGNDTRALDTLDSLGEQDAGQGRIGTGLEFQPSPAALQCTIPPETFPIPPRFR